MMKKIISALLCAAILITSVLGGAVITSAEGGSYTGTIEDYDTGKARTPSAHPQTPSDGGTFEFKGNVALGQLVKASGVEAAGRNGPEMVVDGDRSYDSNTNQGSSFWSSNTMKKGSGTQDPAWVYIDLGVDETDVESISIYYYRVVWATKMEIQTSSDPDANNWRTLVTRTPDDNPALAPVGADASRMHPVDTITSEEVPDIATLDRYVRFYATEMNTSAPGTALGIMEIEIQGTQQRTSANMTATTVMSLVGDATINEDETNVIFPEVPEGFRYEIKGSELDGVIADDGSISPYIIGDRDITFIAQVVNESNKKDKAEKSYTFTIHDKSKNFRELMPVVENPNAKPGIIPAVQEWYGLEGYYTPSSDEVNFVFKVPEGTDEDTKEAVDAAVDKVADAFLNIGFTDAAYIGEEDDDLTAGANDVYFELLDNDDKYFIGDEGNVIIINDNGVKIYANTVTGLLYGGYTIAQGLVTGDGQFPYGVIRDYPQFEIRGVMTDIARSPFRMETLYQLEEVFAWFKISEWHLHVNDARHYTNGSLPNYEDWNKVEGYFRLESTTYPGLTSSAKTSAYFNADEENGFGGTVQYGKDEFRQFLKDGIALGINMMPELDFPGHSLTFTRYVHEAYTPGLIDETEATKRKEALQAVEVNGEIYRTNTSWEHIELDPEDDNYDNSMNFVRGLFEEYVKKGENGEEEVFVGDSVQIGAEEYWNINQDERYGMKAYIEMVKKIIEDEGKKVRMWGSISNYLAPIMEDTAEYADDIILDVWSSGYENARDRIADGYGIVNLCDSYLYNNPQRPGRDTVNVEYLYESWTPYQFQGGYLAPKGEPGVLGAKTSIWEDVTDVGVTETDALQRIIRAAAIVAEKTWGGQGTQSYEEFSLLNSKLIYGPNSYDPYADSAYELVNIDFANYDETAETIDGVTVDGNLETVEEDGKTWGVFDGNTKLTTDKVSVRYPYTVSFDIENGTNTSEANLFTSKDGWLTINNGSLKIYRAFFEQSFYALPTGKHNITLVGTDESVKLYVDGKFNKRLGKINRNESAGNTDNLASTFDFPLQYIGENFNGKLANIKVYSKALSPETIQAVYNGDVIEYVNVAQNRGVAGDAQNVNESSPTWDNANKKLRVGWKAIDGDGNALDGSNGVTYSEMDSIFEGRHADSSIALDFWREYDVSKIVLQWDDAPLEFKLQTSADGKTWTDLETVKLTSSAKTVTTIELETPVRTRYLKMQGVTMGSGVTDPGNNPVSFHLREFMVFEKVDKSLLDWATSSYNRYLSNIGGYEDDIAANRKTATKLIGNPVVEQYMIDNYINSLEAGLQELPEGTVVAGDANFDGTLNIKDATMIQKYAAELVGYENVNLFTADTDVSGDINGADATAIQKYLVGYTETLGQ